MDSRFERIARPPIFSEEERKEFHQRQLTRSAPLLRLALVVSAVASFDFVTWDVYFGSPSESIPLRIVASAFYLALLAIGYADRGTSRIVWGYALYALVFSTSLAGVMVLSPLAFEERLPGILFYVVAMLAVSPHFRWTMAAYLLLWLVTNIGMSQVGTSTTSALMANAFLLSWIVTASAVAYYFDLRRRFDFQREREREKERTLLKRLATVDTLTGVANRRYFLSLLKREIERSRRHNHPLTVAMLDIDHFKSINDTYGHEAGDRCLKAFVKVIEKRIRISDHFGRLGGEEFALIFPETPMEEGVPLVDALRARMETMNMTLEGTRISVTFSSGVAAWKEEDQSADDTLRRADLLLYRAKGNGRNRVESSDDPIEPPSA